MLDVSIRIGVLNLMSELRKREGVSFLYITHDVASARYIADRVLVLYGGPSRRGGADRGDHPQPKHPYTQLLLSAVPDPRADARPRRRERRRRASEGRRSRARDAASASRCPLADRPVRHRDAAAARARRQPPRRLPHRPTRPEPRLSDAACRGPHQTSQQTDSPSLRRRGPQSLAPGPAPAREKTAISSEKEWAGLDSNQRPWD